MLTSETLPLAGIRSDIDVGTVQRVTTHTDRPSRVQAAIGIYLWSYRIKMAWIAAGRRSAKMVEMQSLGYRSLMKLVRETMCIDQ